MTDERDKSSRGSESVARPTARDVPFVRGVASDEEAAPRARRPEHLPRDPSYEAELAQVELAVMRDPQPREDPSTKPGGRFRYEAPASTQPPESVTPESPATHPSREPASQSPEPPASSGGRAVASGTLLSVGSVDPRGKTERTLETPRMFFSQQGASTEAYFKPGKIPAVTVHQTLETETVKLADSIDPRRAKTLPRIDRALLERLAEVAQEPESEAPVARDLAPAETESEDFDRPASAASVPVSWNRADYEPVTPFEHGAEEGQIHASLSPFRDHAPPSYEFEGSPTRPEPFVLRRASDPPETYVPDASTVPTQRDLPQHRIEASRPPPPPVATVVVPAAERSDSAAPVSEIAAPTTASIQVEGLPQPRPWTSYAAFLVALLSAVALGWWLTKSPADSATPQAKPATAPAKPLELGTSSSVPADASTLATPAVTGELPVKSASTAASVVATSKAQRSAPPSSAPAAGPSSSPLAPAAPTSTALRKPTVSKPIRETIF